MILSFGAVCLIAASKYITAEEDEQSQIVDGENTTYGTVVLGSGLVFITAWSYAAVVLITRKMQKIPACINLFYYGIVATLAIVLVIIVESLVTSEAIRFWSYSGEQWFYIFLPCCFNYIALHAGTIASQNERSGFITLLG